MAVTDWSTTAGSNTTLGALSTQGTAQANTIDDLFRELMAQVATFNTGATFGHTAQLSIGGNTPRIGAFGTTVATSGLALGAFNTTAGNAAHLDFYRSKNAAIGSADVVASGDNLGAINWFGAQQTGTFATQTIAAQIRSEVDGVVSSGASGDMPGRIVLATTADAGSTVTDRLILDSAGFFKPAANDGATIGKSGAGFSDSYWAAGAVFDFGNGNLSITHSSGILDYSSGTYRFQSSGSSVPGSGNNLSGVVIDSAGTIYSSRGGQALVINRTSDGTVMQVNSGGTTQGSVSISGATVTWGTFTGAHWSQLASGAAKIDILRGTILETIDEMCDWYALSYVDHLGNQINDESKVPAGAKEGDIVKLEYTYEAPWDRMVEQVETEEYETQETTLISTEVTRIEMRGGQAHQVIEVKEVDTPLFDDFHVLDASGKPAFLEKRIPLPQEDGTIKLKIIHEPLIHRLPRMVVRERTVRREVKESGVDTIHYQTEAKVVRLANDNLPRFKVSDKRASPAVYGVFCNWDPDKEGDANIAALGTFVIRITAGIKPLAGDIIESNGDGCGRVQDDDVFRASTVAKITSGIPVDTYPDGSRLFPCTLHCG